MGFMDPTALRAALREVHVLYYFDLLTFTKKLTLISYYCFIQLKLFHAYGHPMQVSLLSSIIVNKLYIINLHLPVPNTRLWMHYIS